jgi:hypothetical protein
MALTEDPEAMAASELQNFYDCNDGGASGHRRRMEHLAAADAWCQVAMGRSWARTVALQEQVMQLWYPAAGSLHRIRLSGATGPGSGDQIVAECLDCPGDEPWRRTVGPHEVDSFVRLQEEHMGIVRDQARSSPPARAHPPAPDPGLLALLEEGWGVIANAGNGDWDNESQAWREAAVRWRDRYREVLAQAAPPARAEPEAPGSRSSVLPD